MTNTLLRLRKKIPNELVKILNTVFEESDKLGIQAFAIGATVRDLIFEYVYEVNITRATEDIDFGIAVESWEKYDLLKTNLIATGNFVDDIKQEQRLRWINDDVRIRVDLVPFGGLESATGQIAFPPKGDFKMSTVGFAEVYKSAVSLEIDDKLTIKIASLAGLALLKFIAYSDRPFERRRDVHDIWFISQNYLDAGNDDRLYDNAADADLLGEDFDYRTSGARMLGRDIAKIMNLESESIIRKLLEEETRGGNLQKFADIISADEFRHENQYDFILNIFRQLKMGIFE